jgi:hypothetical protein
MDRSERDWLDEAIIKTRPDFMPVPDFAKWQQSHPQAIEALGLGPYRAIRRVGWRVLLATAAMIPFVFGLGLILGRSITNRQMAQMRASVIEAVEAQMSQQMASAAQQYASAALAAANAYTRQQVTGLATAVEATRQSDREQIAAALQQMQLARLQDLTYLGNSLYAWWTMHMQSSDPGTIE